ncbi:MAG: AAA family ATPase [Vicinamibacteraceae bacterium]
MNAEVVIIGAKDRELGRLLAAVNLRTSELPATELATLAHPAARQPDVVVVDLRGGQSLPPTVATLKRQHPTTPVLLVTSSLDPSVVLEAMRAGVNECVAEPLQAKEVETAVARLLAHKLPAASAGQVFAFIGAKGGVGTTTVAVNVATELGRDPLKPTLLVDLHLAHGDAAVFLGVEPRFSVVDALDNIHRFDDAFFKGLVVQSPAGPHLLASSDKQLAQTSSVQRVRSLVEFATGLYRYIVLDVPRSDAAALDALDQASRIVVVANQELATVRNASRIAASLRQRYGNDRITVIVNRVDTHAEIGREDVEKVVGTRVVHSVPSDYRMALRALNKGRPLALDNHNKLAASFRELAHDLAGVVPAPTTPEPGGLFGLLKGRR